MANVLKDPALLVGLFRASLLVAIVFGLSLTEEQEAALVGLVSIALTVVTMMTTQPTPAAARRLGIKRPTTRR